jgi:hypothetical protein
LVVKSASQLGKLSFSLATATVLVRSSCKRGAKVVWGATLMRVSDVPENTLAEANLMSELLAKLFGD